LHLQLKTLHISTQVQCIENNILDQNHSNEKRNNDVSLLVDLAALVLVGGEAVGGEAVGGEPAGGEPAGGEPAGIDPAGVALQ